MIDAETEVSSAAVLSKLAASPEPVAAYPQILCSPGALAVLWGPPGGGKTTAMLRWLNGLRGPVLFLSAEEGLGPVLAQRLVRLGISRPDFGLLGRATVDAVGEEVRRRKAVGLGIDSVQAAMFEPSELRHLLAVLPSLQVVLAVCQVNARGTPEGRNALIHEADIAANVSGMHITLSKSRYQLANAPHDMSVLPGTVEAGNQGRREVAPVRRLRLVRSEGVLSGDDVARGPRTPEPRG